MPPNDSVGIENFDKYNKETNYVWIKPLFKFNDTLY